MVGTTHPGNIGAVARAMKNMCFTNLILVDPQCLVDDTAYARASGAYQILDECRTVMTLQAAIADCHLVVGLTARHRSLPWPTLTPRQLSQTLVNTPDRRTALVFGREHSGLSNDELMLCHYMLSIAANPEFNSLNVAAAAQIICYEIYQQILSVKHPCNETTERAEPIATAGELEGYFAHLEQVLQTIQFMDSDNPGLLMQRLRRLYLRINMRKSEVNILRGILNSVQKYKA